MKKLTFALLSFSMTGLLFGCKPAATPTTTSTGGGVAVIDLDRVAKAMGWNEEMNKNLDETKTSVTEQFNNHLKLAQHAIEAKRDEIVKSLGLSDAKKEELNNAKSKDDLKKLGLSDKQIEELSQAFAVAYNEGNGAAQRLNPILEAQKTKIIQAYVEAVKPAVRRVAIANDKSVVLLPGGGMLYNDSNSDITDKVVDEMKFASGSINIVLPPIPQLKFEQTPATPSTSASSLTPAPAATPTAAPTSKVQPAPAAPVVPPATTNP